MNLIAETAFHHEGDFDFMRELVLALCKSPANIIKYHLLLDLDKYMLKDHVAYDILKPMLFSSAQWEEIFTIITDSGKDMMSLLNDVPSVELAAKHQPKLIELHSVALNDKSLIDSVKQNFSKNTKVVLGVGGSTIYEIENAAKQLDQYQIVLMFGFQNYPTKYSDVNFKKVKKIMSAFPEFSFGYADHTAWNEPSNVLITLLGAAQGMDYIEKHTTIKYGQERMDYSAAISLEMLDEVYNGLKILKECQGDGLLALNSAEEKYCVPGVMKKAAVLIKDINAGEIVDWNAFSFMRTGQQTDISQIEIWNLVGKIKAKEDLKSGTVLQRSNIERLEK